MQKGDIQCKSKPKDPKIINATQRKPEKHSILVSLSIEQWIYNQSRIDKLIASQNNHIHAEPPFPEAVLVQSHCHTNYTAQGIYRYPTSYYSPQFCPKGLFGATTSVISRRLSKYTIDFLIGQILFHQPFM